MIELTVAEQNAAATLTTLGSDNVELDADSIVVVTNNDYNKLKNHPSIEDVELVGNVTLDDIGVRTIIETELKEAKASGEFDGPQGPTGPEGPQGPEGQQGPTGKTAYQYAVDGGYTGTEQQFAAKLAAEGVTSFNGQTGAITYTAPVTSVNGSTGAVTVSVPTSVSELANDSDYTTKTYVDGEDGEIRGTIFFGKVDDTSTNTAFTATIDGVTEYHDGLAILLKNGVVTSAAGFTIDINGLGAKQVYSNMAAATAEATTFNVNYTILFVYDSTRVEGGAWIYYRGYYSDANSIGYQLRTNSGTLPATEKFYRYRLLFTSADGTKWVPANTSSSTNATSSRTTNTTPIDPFGPIVYYSATGAVNANANPSATAIWQQYVVTLGYSFNNTGAALTLTPWKPVYLRCTPNADGSAVMDYFTQSKPTTEDGKIYIFLGIANAATTVELRMEHPVYYYKTNGLRLWTGSN